MGLKLYRIGEYGIAFLHRIDLRIEDMYKIQDYGIEDMHRKGDYVTENVHRIGD